MEFLYTVYGCENLHNFFEKPVAEYSYWDGDEISHVQGGMAVDQNILKQKLCIMHNTGIPSLGILPPPPPAATTKT